MSPNRRSTDASIHSVQSEDSKEDELISRSEQEAILKEARKQEAKFNEFPVQRKRKFFKRKFKRKRSRKSETLEPETFPMHELLDPSILYSHEGEVMGEEVPKEEPPKPEFLYPSDIPPECMDPNFFIPHIKPRKRTFHNEIQLQIKRMEEQARIRAGLLGHHSTLLPSVEKKKVTFSSRLSYIPSLSVLFERAAWEGECSSTPTYEEEVEYVAPKKIVPRTYKSAILWKSRVPSLKQMIKDASEPAPTFRRTVDWKYKFFQTDFAPYFTSSPQLFMNRVPTSLEISEAKSSVIIAPFPKLSRGSRQIIYFGLRDGREQTMDPVGIMKFILMIMDTIPLVNEMRYRGYLFIVNLDGITYKNLAISKHALRYADFFSYLRKTTGPDPPITLLVSFKDDYNFNENIASALSMCMDPTVESWPALFLRSIETLRKTMLKPRLLPKELGGSLQSMEVMYSRLLARVEEMLPLWSYLESRDFKDHKCNAVDVDEQQVLDENMKELNEKIAVVNHFLDVKRAAMKKKKPTVVKEKKRVTSFKSTLNKPFPPGTVVRYQEYEEGKGGHLYIGPASSISSSFTESSTSTTSTSLSRVSIDSDSTFSFFGDSLAPSDLRSPRTSLNRSSTELKPTQSSSPSIRSSSVKPRGTGSIRPKALSIESASIKSFSSGSFDVRSNSTRSFSNDSTASYRATPASNRSTSTGPISTRSNSTGSNGPGPSQIKSSDNKPQKVKSFSPPPKSLSLRSNKIRSYSPAPDRNGSDSVGSSSTTSSIDEP